MAKSKKKSGKRKDPHESLDPQEQTERFARGITESAQQIWLAGLGAFARAQAEGTKMFETLVKEGAGFEKAARNAATGQAESMREAMESRIGLARERMHEGWGRFEKVFEDRLHRSMAQMGVPSREELNALSAQVEALRAELQARGATATSRKSTAARKQASRKAPAKSAAKKAPARARKRTM